MLPTRRLVITLGILLFLGIIGFSLRPELTGYATLDWDSNFTTVQTSLNGTTIHLESFILNDSAVSFLATTNDNLTIDIEEDILTVLPHTTGSFDLSIIATSDGSVAQKDITIIVQEPEEKAKPEPVLDIEDGKLKDDSDTVVGQQVEDDPDFQTVFHSVTKNSTHLKVVFSHDSTLSQPVWVEGNVTYELSSPLATAGEQVTLSVELVNGKVPKFKLHVGPESDVFQFGITVITVQSFPIVGGDWQVLFNTTGQADLSVTAINSTAWGTDLNFSSIKCGSTPQNTTFNGTSYTVENYTCNNLGTEISNVLTAGKHTLHFLFGDDEAYAYNDATDNITFFVNASPTVQGYNENVTIIINITKNATSISSAVVKITLPNQSTTTVTATDSGNSIFIAKFSDFINGSYQANATVTLTGGGSTSNHTNFTLQAITETNIRTDKDAYNRSEFVNLFDVPFVNLTGINYTIGIFGNFTPQNGTADIVWIVDRSGSMLPIQAEIANTINSFTSQLTLFDIDFRLGVTCFLGDTTLQQAFTSSIAAFQTAVRSCGSEGVQENGMKAFNESLNLFSGSFRPDAARVFVVVSNEGADDYFSPPRDLGAGPTTPNTALLNEITQTLQNNNVTAFGIVDTNDVNFGNEVVEYLSIFNATGGQNFQRNGDFSQLMSMLGGKIAIIAGLQTAPQSGSSTFREFTKQSNLTIEEIIQNDIDTNPNTQFPSDIFTTQASNITRFFVRFIDVTGTDTLGNNVTVNPSLIIPEFRDNATGAVTPSTDIDGVRNSTLFFFYPNATFISRLLNNASVNITGKLVLTVERLVNNEFVQHFTVVNDSANNTVRQVLPGTPFELLFKPVWGTNKFNTGTSITGGSPAGKYRARAQFYNLDGTTVMNDSKGVPMDAVFNFTILGNTVQCGIDLEESVSLQRDQNGSGAGYCFNITRNNVSINCNDFILNATATADKQGKAIISNHTVAAEVHNCTIQNWARGVDFTQVNSSVIKQNLIFGNTEYGIILKASPDHLIDNNTIENSTGTNTDAIAIDYFLENTTGVVRTVAPRGQILRNLIRSIARNGIEVFAWANELIQDNTIQSTTRGMDVQLAGNLTIQNNMITNASNAGIRFTDRSMTGANAVHDAPNFTMNELGNINESTIKNNTFEDNTIGMLIEGSSFNNTIANNTFNQSTTGIKLDGGIGKTFNQTNGTPVLFEVEDTLIQNNTFEGGTQAIILTSRNGSRPLRTKVFNNTVRSTLIGINATFNNNLVEPGTGTYPQNPGRSRVTNARAEENNIETTQVGMFLQETNRTTLRNNTFSPGNSVSLWVQDAFNTTIAATSFIPKFSIYDITQFGRINLTDQVNVTADTSLQTAMNISFNMIRVTTALFPFFNITGRLTFRNLSNIMPAPTGAIVAFDEANFTGCPLNVCSNFQSSAGTATYSVKHFTNYSTNSSLLNATKTASTTNPEVGTQFTYTITVTNTAPQTLFNITVIENLPTGLSFISSTPAQNSTSTWMLGSLASGASETITETVKVDSNLQNGITLTNTIDVSAVNSTGNPLVPTSSAETITVSVPNKGNPEVGSFPAGIKISTPNRHKLIENIKLGDEVWSYDEKDGIEKGRVIRKYTRLSNEGYEITLSTGQKLIVTAEHPLYTGKGYVRVKNLRTGMSLYKQDRKQITPVRITNIKKLSNTIRVYNFHVDGNNNYFADGILAHNKVGTTFPPPPPPPPPPPIRLTRPEKFEIPIQTLFCPPVPTSNLNDTSVACACVLEGHTPDKISASITSLDARLPPGYELMTEPFRWGCENDRIDFSLNLPDNYEDVQILKCREGTCTRITKAENTEELMCRGKPISKLERETLLDKDIILPQEIQRLQPQRQIVTPENNTYTIGPLTITFRQFKEPFTLTLSTPLKPIPSPQNTMLEMITTPITVKTENAPEGIEVQLEYDEAEPDTIVQGTAGIWKALDDKWVEIRRGYTMTGNLPREFTVARIGTFCSACVESKLTKTYDGGGKNAIVLVHGLLSNPSTWKSLINDIELTKQDWQVWTYAYPSTINVQQAADDFSGLMNKHANEFDKALLVGHSVGALVIQQSLYDSQTSAYILKVKGAVLVASPNKGSQGLEAYRSLLENIQSKRSKIPLFSLDAPMLQEALDGKSIPQVEGIPYFVLAGTKPYEFPGLPEEQLKELNDGVITTKSAQTLPTKVINNKCKDYFEINLTHTELIDNPLPRKVLARIAAITFGQENKKAVYGFNQYVHSLVEGCSGKNTYLVIGKPTAKRKALMDDCSCGDGICGLGETAESCPTDCAEMKSQITACTALSSVMYFLLVILFVLTGLTEFRAHWIKAALPINPMITTWALVGITAAVTVTTFVLCGIDILAATLFSIVVIMLGTGPFHNHVLESRKTAGKPVKLPAPAPKPEKPYDASIHGLLQKIEADTERIHKLKSEVQDELSKVPQRRRSTLFAPARDLLSKLSGKNKTTLKNLEHEEKRIHKLLKDIRKRIK